MSGQELKDFFRTTLEAQRTIAQEFEVLDALVDFAAQNDATGIPDWVAGLTFQLDGTDDGSFCTEPDTNGRIRFWKTKVDDNTGNQPPTDPLITENAYWIEVSPSDGSSIKEWAAGVFGDGLVIVYWAHSVDGRGFYLLTEATRPFNSSNIETEIAAGKWSRLPAKELYHATATGTNTYAATVSPSITAYAIDLKVYIKFTNGNSSAATLNLNGLGAKSIKKSGTVALASGDISAGQILCLVYDGTNFQVVGGGGGTSLTDPLVFKGVIDCSANPNYPAADAGDVYKVSVAGKIGGGSGLNVEVGDTLLCTVDSSSSGNHATVGANWNIFQYNLEIATQAESEDAASNGTVSAINHAKILSPRGWRWAWDKVKTLAQTIAAEWTFNDIKLANQAGTGNCLGYLDSTGKFVRIADFSFNSSTGELTLNGTDDSTSTYVLKLLNDSGALIARFANGQFLELGGSTFVIEVGSGVTSGNARIVLNDDQAMALIFEDTNGKEYISIRSTDGDERFNVRVKQRLDALSGLAPIDLFQFSATANATNSSVTLIGSIPMATDEEMVHAEVDFFALSTSGAGGFQRIKAAVQRVSGGTVQAFGASVADTIQRTAGTFLFSVDADNTNKRINLNFTQNTSGGVAYLLVANVKWTRMVEP